MYSFSEFEHRSILRRAKLVLLLIILFFARPAFVIGFTAQQDDEVPPCFIGFVGKPSAILASSFIKNSGFLPGDRESPEVFLMNDSVSVRGVISLPQDFSEIAEGGPDKLDYYLEFTLKTDAQDSRFFKFIEKRGEKTGEEGKALIYQVEGNPVFQAIFEGKRIILASNAFEYAKNDLPPMTDRLEKLLDEYSKSEGFAAIDAKSARPLLESAAQFGIENFPAMARPVLEMMLRMNGVVVSLEMDEIAFFKARVELERSEDAKELVRIVDELVDMAKANAQGPHPNNVMATKILKTVKCRSSGSDVEISVEIDEDATKQSKLAALEANIMNNQRQAVLSVHNFLDAYRKLPFLAAEGQSDQLSWRVRVLPFLDQSELYERFDLSQSWDSPQNRKVFEEIPMPAFYGDTGTKTNLCWVKSKVQTLEEITRGTSNTIAFVHSDKYVNWTENNDVTPDEVIAQFKALKEGEYLIASFYDGSVRKIPAGTDLKEFSAMLVPTDDD